MKKDTILQFVGFVTSVDADTFAPEWEKYARKLMNKKADTVLEKKAGNTKSRFRYISRHEWQNPDVRFAFMNERKSEHFPDMSVQVVQVGGYIELEGHKASSANNTLTKLVAFISHDENDIDFYRQLPFHKYLNLYQAFYESCVYGYVIEFFVPETDTEEMLLALKQRNGVDAAIYKECLVPHL